MARRPCADCPFLHPRKWLLPERWYDDPVYKETVENSTPNGGPQACHKEVAKRPEDQHNQLPTSENDVCLGSRMFLNGRL